MEEYPVADVAVIFFFCAYFDVVVLVHGYTAGCCCIFSIECDFQVFVSFFEFVFVVNHCSFWECVLSFFRGSVNASAPFYCELVEFFFRFCAHTDVMIFVHGDTAGCWLSFSVNFYDEVFVTILEKVFIVYYCPFWKSEFARRWRAVNTITPFHCQGVHLVIFFLSAYIYSVVGIHLHASAAFSFLAVNSNSEIFIALLEKVLVLYHHISS